MICMLRWVCEYEKPFFDAEKIIARPHNSPKIPVQSDLTTEETLNTPGTAISVPEKFFLKRKNYVT